jgi:hypothetical protein
VTRQRSARVIPTEVGISSGTLPTAVPTYVGTTEKQQARSARFGLFSYGTEFPFERLFDQKQTIRSEAMSLLIYLALFVAACGFGWWAKGSEKRS